jgi:hypothetical protein
MSDPSPETLQQMRDLCAKISVAHDLDESIQEELLGHMEDKLLGYLSGNETLSERDAFILVREHFGEPATIKALLQDAHPGAVRESLARRFGAILVTAMAIEALMRFGFLAPGWLWCALSIYCATPLLLGLLLLRWQRMIAAGKKPWFLKVSPRMFAYLLFLLMVLWGFMAIIYHESLPAQPIESPMPPWLNLGLRYAAGIASCLIWVWWYDRPPRRMFAMGGAIAGWAVSRVLQTFAWTFGVFYGGYFLGLRYPLEEVPLITYVLPDLVWIVGKEAMPCAVAVIGLYVFFRSSWRRKLSDRMGLSFGRNKCSIV